MTHRFYNIIFFIIVVSLTATAFSCRFNNIQNMSPVNIEHIENEYFTLDFEKNCCAMSDVETYFFTTFPHDDPTLGDVVYDRRKWLNANMVMLKKGDGLYLYIKSRNDDNKFDSVRITSKAYYNLNENTQGLLFAFKGKMPSARAVWPAWWLNGSKQDKWLYKDLGRIENDAGLDRYSGKGQYYDTPSAVNSTDWPGAGEIDIIETINGDNVIHNTIHTCPQMCDSEWNNDGRIINCANAKSEVEPNSGCSGAAYNSVNAEGTFACLWERNTIKYYYWNAGENVRSDGGPLSANPDPGTWRKENVKNEVRLIETKTKCDTGMHGEWQCKNCDASDACSFKNMKMIFNITLCGIWAGYQFDNSEKPRTNCQAFIIEEGKNIISNQFLKIEYISARKI